jgi:flagellar hook-associated protein 3
MNNLNDAATNLDEASNQVTSGMRFSKASEDPASALKAFKVRRSLARADQYQSNITDYKGTLDQTETSLMGINEVLVQAKESLTQGSNGTMSDENRKIISDIFKNLQDQVLKLGNTNFAGRYIFGGPNTTAAPFTVDSGKLLYNGKDVSTDDVSREEVFVDMGIGLAFDGSNELIPGTAVSVSTPGSVALGYGTDSNGLPNNVYNLLGDVAKALEDNDTSKLQLYIDKLGRKADDILVQVAGVGERVSFAEFLGDRITADKLNLQKKQNDIEGVNQASAITQYKSTEMAYKAALQMGSKIIETSLLDFLR